MWRLSHFGTYLFHYLNKQKSYAPYTYQLCWCFIVNYRPNTVNFGYLGLLLKGKEIHFMDVKEGIFFWKSMQKCRKVKSWIVSWVGDSEREASITLHVYRKVLCSERFWWILEHHDTFLPHILQILQGGDADCWCKLGVSDIRCRADNGHVLCNLGVSRVPFFPKVRVTLKTETGATQNWRKKTEMTRRTTPRLKDYNSLKSKS